MEIDFYNINNKNDSIKQLEEEFEKLKSFSGNISHKLGKKFIQLSKTYKDTYNLLAKDILINKLKIDIENAKNIHKNAWDQLLCNDLASYNNNFIQKYLTLISDLATNLIESSTLSDNKKNLENFIYENISSKNIDVEIKKRWAFVWKFISEKDDLEKKIFMYKLFAGLSFKEISIIVKKDENIILNKYFEVESDLFNRKDFKLFFNIK